MNMSFPSRAKGGARPSAKGVGHGPAAAKKTIRIPNRSPEELELAAQLLQQVKDLPNVRQELCERIRQQIAEGVYVTTERLEIAAERLVEEILADGGLDPTDETDPAE